MEDFKQRLHTSIAAAAEGQDEVRAFREGVKFDDESSKDVVNQEIKLDNNRLTYRNT